MTGSNETTKAQGQSNEGDKTSNAKDQKIITDIDSVMQVTRYILKNDWKDLEEYIMSKTSNTLIDKITGGLSIFDLIVNSDAPPMFLDKLVSKVHQNFLQEWVSNEGNACMVHAATGGKSKLIEILMRYNANLPNVRDESKLLPIHKAAQLGQRDTVRYLLSKTTEHLDGHDWSTLLKDLINCNLFDIALNLLKEYPEIARGEIADTGKILELLSKRPKAFASGSRLGFWKGLLYRWIPAQEECGPHPHLHSENADGDLEKQLSETSPFAFGSLHKKLKTVLWNSLTRLAPSIKSIRNTKLTHKQTLEILRIICVGAVDIATAAKETENVLKKPMFTAAKFGIYEIVMEIIISYFPWSLSFSNEDGDDIFHVAVKHRQEKVFNIIFNMPKAQTFFVADIDVKGVNILHSAARSVPSSEVSGAALQMQRELQWFKAVENYVHPTLQDQLNDKDKTPRELFTEEHKGLVKEGEKWMKDTAQSCSLVATLVITIAFAAAITVPGDSDSRGMPNYLHEPSFTIFGISNALALFSSVVSVLMFLGILTSRFSEEDFLVSLPRKLIIGLITLFFSIASLMVAFAATVYIVQFHQWKWVIIPMGLLGCLPVYLFATLQFRLLVEVLFSTYGPGIFKPLNYLRM